MCYLPYWVNGKCTQTMSRKAYMTVRINALTLLVLLVKRKRRREFGTVGHSCNSNTLETEAGRLRVRDHPRVYYQVQGQPGYMKHCTKLKVKKRERDKKKTLNFTAFYLHPSHDVIASIPMIHIFI